MFVAVQARRSQPFCTGKVGVLTVTEDQPATGGGYGGKRGPGACCPSNAQRLQRRHQLPIRVSWSVSAVYLLNPPSPAAFTPGISSSLYPLKT